VGVSFLAKTSTTVVPPPSLIIVYVHPEHLPAVLALAGHEVVVGRVVRRRPRLKTAGTPIVGGVAHRIGRRRGRVVRGMAAGAADAAARQAVRAVVVVGGGGAARPLTLVAVAGRAPALRIVVVEGVVGGRTVGHVVLPLVGVRQQLLLIMYTQG